MGKIKVIRVVFSILLVQLFGQLSVNADEKADYFLAQKGAARSLEQYAC